MSVIKLPYGKGNLTFESDKYNSIRVLESNKYDNPAGEQEIVNKALKNPIASKSLSELARGAKRVLIVTNDMTRPMPSGITLPALIGEINRYNTKAEITILIASGLHRAMTREELIDKMGKDIVERYSILVHDARDKSSLINLGRLSSGNVLWLNKEIRDCGIIVAEGFIEAHFFAGFSGGRKSILPGIAGEETIMFNHSPKNLDDPRTVAGNLDGNPIHSEQTEAAKIAGLTFILNVALDRDKKIINAFAGDPYIAHEEGCKFVRSLQEVKCEPADITVTTNSGYPLDLNLYQSAKGINTAAAATKPGGTIIMCSECSEGIGHGGFAEVLEKSADPELILNEMRKGNIQVADQWNAHILLGVLTNYRVILISSIERKTIERMNMIYAKDLGEAFNIAKGFCSEEPLINVIPEGPVIIPEII